MNEFKLFNVIIIRSLHVETDQHESNLSYKIFSKAVRHVKYGTYKSLANSAALQRFPVKIWLSEACFYRSKDAPCRKWKHFIAQ